MRRAHENGKVDAIDVEALGDVLDAETEFQRRLAVDGSIRLRNASFVWRETLIDCLAIVEAHIDFSDEGDVSSFLSDQFLQSLRILENEIRDTCSNRRFSERIRTGFKVTILGPVNAGKSSLFNALADREFAIISSEPGTTRDVLEVHLDFDGVPIILSDTAGLRETHELIENEGIRRAEAAAVNSDLVLWVSAVDSPAKPPNAQFLPVYSKADLVVGSVTLPSDGKLISVVTGTGLAELANSIREHALAGDVGIGNVAIVAHERQAILLLEAADALRRAREFSPDNLDLIAEEIRMACHVLDRLIGRVGTEDILDALFSRFCIGK